MAKEVGFSILTPKAIAGIISFFLIVSTLFVVHEGQGALVMRLGAIKGDGTKAYVYNPGLHFKVPLIDRARFFDVRLQTLEQQSSRILTKEQKYVLVDYYVKWRIQDLALYFKRTSGRAYRTKELISQKVNDALRAAFGERTITEVV